MLGKISALLIVLMVGSASAEPIVINSATVDAKTSSVIISFTQPDLVTMQGCHYNVRASWRKDGLDTLPGNSISIATFKRDETFVQIIATPERRLRRKESGPLSRAWANLYIRTMIPCDDNQTGQAAMIRVRVPTFKNGKINTLRGFIREMKYHMAYYTPG